MYDQLKKNCLFNFDDKGKNKYAIEKESLGIVHYSKWKQYKFRKWKPYQTPQKNITNKTDL